MPPQARTSSWARGWFATALVVLGTVLLQAGMLAGYVNRHVLDADRLAASVDELRQDPAVAAALGRALTDAFLESEPDAVAIRPLVDTVATSVVGSSALSGPTKAAVVQLQKSLTEQGADTVVLRIADAGAVLTSVLQRIAPPGTVSVPSNIPLELAHIGDQSSFAGTTIKLARYVRTAAWLLPLAGVTLMALGVALSARRRRSVLVAGITLIGLTGVLALALLVGGWWAGSRDAATLSGALISHGWAVLVDPLWWTLLIAAAIGLLLTAMAASLLPSFDPTALFVRAVRAAGRRPDSTFWQILRAAGFVTAAVLSAVRPVASVAAVGLLGAAWLLLYGVHELSAATVDDQVRQTRRTPGAAAAATPRRGRAVGVAVVAGVVAVGLVGGLVLVGTSSSTASSTASVQGTVTGAAKVCNGHAGLCARRFDQVAYVTSHNAMSTASDPRWFLPEQGRSITGQLDNGVRALLIDVWPGFPTTDGKVATSLSAYADAKAQLERDLGPESVQAALRVVGSVSDRTPAGPEALYMCHGLCELGWTDFQASMAQVKTWLDTHPDEVLTIGVENHVPAARIAAALQASGLAAYAATPPAPGGTWPTLKEMITSGKRLVVVAEQGDAGTAYPWLQNAYDRLVQETPYTAESLEALKTCTQNRGKPDAPLLLMNHWLSGFGSLVTDARKANTSAVLGARAKVCRQERQLPNFVAVNYADIGDVRGVVDMLNGVGS